MALAVRIGILVLLVGVTNAACLGLEAPSNVPTAVATIATSTASPSPTVTPFPPTTTPTSSPTATATSSPTPGSAFPNTVVNPDGTVNVLPGATGTGSGLPGQSPLPGFPLPAGVPGSGTGTGAGGASGGGVPATTTNPNDDASPIWGCDGDERMEFLPVSPMVGEKTYIIVTARRNRAFGLIIGPGLTGVPGQSIEGGSGLKKGWSFSPPSAGTLTYQYYGGPLPEHLCVTGSVTVGGPSPTPTVTGTPTRTPTNTPTPIGTPRPDH